MGVGVVWTLWDTSSPETDLRALVRSGYFCLADDASGIYRKRPFGLLYIGKSWLRPQYEVVLKNLLFAFFLLEAMVTGVLS